MTRITEAIAEPIEIPLRHVFATAQDTAARRVSRLVRVRLELDNGGHGVGECVPVQYVTGETQASALEVVEAALPALAGQSVDRPEQSLRAAEASVADRLGGKPMSEVAPSARAAIEMALWDALCQDRRIHAWTLFGGARSEVVTDVTIPMTDTASDMACQYAEHGFRCFKVKLGRGDPSHDLAVLRTIRNAVPEARFRLDANQAFSADDALEFLDQARRLGFNIECFEQPVARDHLDALDRVAQRSSAPVFADEAVRTPADVYEVVSRTRAHGINVKLMKAGIRGALAEASIARASGRKVMIGCMLETRRGIGWALALAAGTGMFDLYDLDSHMLLAQEDDTPEDAWDSVAFAQEGPILRVSQR